MHNKKTVISYRKDDRAMHLIYECPVNAPAKLEVRTSPVPELIAIGVLVGVVNPNLGEEEVVGGRGWYHSKLSW